MEPPYKRPRFYRPLKSKQDPYGDFDISDEENNCPHDDKGRIERGNDIGAMPDRHYELDQIRTKLDDKLKSKFEAIFEKYSKDFTGVGDEIDLRSGEIVVDNGHLLRMEDEWDAGTSSSILPVASSQVPERKLGSNEAESIGSDTTDYSYVALEDMEEDDMIFFQDSRVAKRNLTTPPPEPISDYFLQQQADITEIDPHAQHLYPQDSQQRELDHSRTELALHAPYLPLATPRSHVVNSTKIYPNANRSPSPIGSSVWAPSMPRGRRRRDGADLAAVFKGETTVGNRKWQPSPKFPTTITRKITGPIRPKRTTNLPAERKKTNYTEAAVAVGPSNGSSSNCAITSYMTTVVTNPERDSSDGASISSFNSHHPHSDSEIKPNRGWPTQLDHKQPRLRVVSGDYSYFKHKSEGEIPTHVPFTQADDDATIDCIKRAQRLGISLWSKKPWKALAEKGHPRQIFDVLMGFDIQTLPNSDDKNENGLGHSERNTNDSVGQIQPTEYFPMATFEAYASQDDDNARTIVRDHRITSTLKLASNNLNGVAYKTPSDPRGVLSTEFQPVKRSPINEPISGVLSLSSLVDIRPPYSFSDEDEDGDHSDEKLTNAEAFYDDELPGQSHSLQEQFSDQKEEAHELSRLRSRVLGEQHTVEQIAPLRETSLRFDIVEELLSNQKSIEVESPASVEIGETRDSIQAGGIKALISASKIYSCHMPYKMEILKKSPRSRTGILEEQPAGVVRMFDQQTSQGEQGLGGEISPSEGRISTRPSARSEPDGLQFDIGTNGLTDQPHIENVSPDEHEDSTLAQATENKTHYTSAEAGTYEDQIRGRVLRETLIGDEPVSRKLPRPTRPSAKSPRGSSPRMESFRLKISNISEELDTPTSSHSRSCQQKLSSILGPDDFEELQPNCKSLVKPSLRVAIYGPGKKTSRISPVAIDKPKLNSTLTPTRLSSAMRKGIRRSSGINSSNASLASPMAETKFGIILQCGEKGFKCTKNFCFKCIEN